MQRFIVQAKVDIPAPVLRIPAGSPQPSAVQPSISEAKHSKLINPLLSVGFWMVFDFLRKAALQAENYTADHAVALKLALVK